MKKLLVLLMCLASLPSIIAQDKGLSSVSLTFGAGSSLHGSGDMITLALENGLQYRLNESFSAAVDLHYGKSDFGVYVSSSFVQGNLNVLWSPFSQLKKHDVKLGFGFSYMNVSDFYEASDEWIDGYIDRNNYAFDKRNSFGYNIILRYDYLLTEKYLLGLKLFTQNYFNGDISTGGLLRFGIRL